MSEVAMRDREWKFFVTDMIEFCERVLSYTEGMSKAEFLANGLVYDATLRNLRLIGESATHIPDEVRDANQHIAWQRIIGMRNRLTHGYLAVNDNVVWRAIRVSVPELLDDLRELLKRIDEGKV